MCFFMVWYRMCKGHILWKSFIFRLRRNALMVFTLVKYLMVKYTWKRSRTCPDRIPLTHFVLISKSNHEIKIFQNNDWIFITTFKRFVLGCIDADFYNQIIIHYWHSNPKHDGTRIWNSISGWEWKFEN